MKIHEYHTEIIKKSSHEWIVEIYFFDQIWNKQRKVVININISNFPDLETGDLNDIVNERILAEISRLGTDISEECNLELNQQDK